MAQTAEAPNAGIRFFRWVLQRQTHQIQDELKSCISVSTYFFNRLVSDFSEGRVSCVCITFVVMGGRSHTHQETIFCSLSCWLSPCLAAFLSVSGNSDAVGLVIFWMSSLSLCLKPSSSGRRVWLEGAVFAALFLPTCCSALSSFVSALLYRPNRCGHVSSISRCPECMSLQKSSSSSGS